MTEDMKYVRISIVRSLYELCTNIRQGRTWIFSKVTQSSSSFFHIARGPVPYLRNTDIGFRTEPDESNLFFFKLYYNNTVS
jgi:hypothetical protein